MTPPLRVLVVAHTHWDREWYHSAGRFRNRLVALIDELLDDPPEPGASFLLDGQAIVLDDYLAIRPERRAELAGLLRDGRLEAGPWYVLADELIPSGEALVRNLLAGRDALRGVRAESPPVLYCPDAFGHPAALPDLAIGFGLPLVIVWRGYGGHRWPDGDTVRWRGKSGQDVLLHHLAPDGYELGSSLPDDAPAADERWRRLASVLSPRSALGLALLPNGADHHARQRGQREAVARLAESARPTEIAASSMRGFTEALVGAARGRTLPTIEGELRDSYGYTWTLQGTLGSRAAQKRENARLERSLVRDVEPWIALGADGGGEGARALLRAVWRLLLEGHPHDTLCGTSIDAVAAALDARHADVADRTQAMRDDAIGVVLEHDAERARRSTADWRPVVVVRNPAPRPRGGIIELELEATVADVAVGPGSASRQGARRRPPPWRVEGVALQLLGRSERVALTESPRDYPDADVVAAATAVGWIGELPGYVVTTRLQSTAARVRTAMPDRVVRVDGTTLDNGLMTVEVEPDGRVRVHDLVSGRSIEDAINLEDASDVGDLYTPAIRDVRELPSSNQVRVVHRGPLRGEISIERRWRSVGRGASSNRCLISVALDAGAPFVRIRVDGTNAATDHRLRLRLATGLRGATTIADAAFHLVERDVPSLSVEDEAMERFVPTAPLHRYVSRYDAGGGATIFSDGLAEYESLTDGAIAVTLLRAVGELSRHDLPERPGHAGWPVPTPLAQSLGPYGAAFALAMHGPDTPQQRAAVEQMADDVLLPLTGRTLRSNLREPRSAGGLELTGDGLAFGAALPARESGWIVLRCVNRRDVEVQGSWRTTRPIAEAALARLDETPLSASQVEGNTVRFTAPPNAIVTVLVRWSDVR